MAKIFYDHLVIREELTAELDLYNISKEEREELINLIDQTLHHQVLNVILKNLPPEKHEQFLLDFHHRPHDPQLLQNLKEDIGDIEEKIKEEAVKVKKELLSEIKRAGE